MMDHDCNEYDYEWSVEDERDYRSLTQILIDDLPEALANGWAPITTHGYSKVWREQDKMIWIYKCSLTVQ